MDSWDKQSMRPVVFDPIVATIQRVTEAPTIFKGMYHLEAATDLAVIIALAVLKLPAERLLVAKERIKAGAEAVKRREGFRIQGLTDGLEGWV